MAWFWQENFMMRPELKTWGNPWLKDGKRYDNMMYTEIFYKMISYGRRK